MQDTDISNKDEPSIDFFYTRSYRFFKDYSIMEFLKFYPFTLKQVFV